tara:strand:+ start:2262 stop:2900 length:639 start_codon:yes stop_codon:yes gene_type:complete
VAKVSGNILGDDIKAVFSGFPNFSDLDHEADEHYGWITQSEDLKPASIVSAAVLVPLITHSTGVTILLTQRAGNLATHPGQISFPGGKTEIEDDGPEDTALREAEEEIGLSRENVQIIGRLGRRTTGSGFRVTPIVGLIDPILTLKRDRSEVEKIFEIPLSFVLDETNHRRETRILKGHERKFYVLPFEGHYIWGLTARLLVALRDVLKPRS